MSLVKVIYDVCTTTFTDSLSNPLTWLLFLVNKHFVGLLLYEFDVRIIYILKGENSVKIYEGTFLEPVKE